MDTFPLHETGIFRPSEFGILPHPLHYDEDDDDLQTDLLKKIEIEQAEADKDIYPPPPSRITEEKSTSPTISSPPAKEIHLPLPVPPPPRKTEEKSTSPTFPSPPRTPTTEIHLQPRTKSATPMAATKEREIEIKEMITRYNAGQKVVNRMADRLEKLQHEYQILKEKHDEMEAEQQKLWDKKTEKQIELTRLKLDMENMKKPRSRAFPKSLARPPPSPPPQPPVRGKNPSLLMPVRDDPEEKSEEEN